MVKVSLLTPAIRTHNWLKFYESAKLACKKYPFELVLISPFEPPSELKGIKNIKVIRDYGCPSRATEIGVEHCEGEFLLNCVDDGVFFEDCIDACVDYFDEKCTQIDIINLRYRESANADRPPFPATYWQAWPNGLALPGVHRSWLIALHFFMKRDWYKTLGGIDCSFEYVNHSLHDLVFRAQARGSVVHLSPIEGLNCTHYPETSGDHGPIHHAQLGHDAPLFNRLYSDSYAAYRDSKTFKTWKDCSPIWERRFNPECLPTSYEELNYG